MQIYNDPEANLNLLAGRRIAVIGYGNQGRAQALNLRDSGLDVVVGNRDDAYAERARDDGFDVRPIAQAAAQASVVLLLIPDEVMPDVFEAEVAPHLAGGDALVLASGYTVAFGLLAPPPGVDVVLVAPRMIGAGVRDLYAAGRGFPAFFGVEQDATGRARDVALALAKGIGATRMGAVEVTFAQEAELDLFTEQCFGPAFGQVLTTAVELLLEEGYPPEAVLLELYMSGELAYTLSKIAEMGLIEQSALHSRTSQYGSMSRGMRFILPQLRERMAEGLKEIRSGAFAREWAAEQEAGAPTLERLKAAARSLPLYQLERELREALGQTPRFRPDTAPSTPAPAASVGFLGQAAARLRRLRRRSEVRPDPQPPTAPSRPASSRLGQALARLRRLRRRREMQPDEPEPAGTLSLSEQEQVLRAFLDLAAADPALQTFAQDRDLKIHYELSDADLEFYMHFRDGSVTGGLGAPSSPAEVRLTAEADLLDGMLSGRVSALRAAMRGRLSLKGDARAAMTQQQIQDDLIRLYRRARREIAPERSG